MKMYSVWNGPEGKRWIRLTFREDDGKKSGVVEDVTEETLKT